MDATFSSKGKGVTMPLSEEAMEQKRSAATPEAAKPLDALRQDVIDAVKWLLKAEKDMEGEFFVPDYTSLDEALAAYGGAGKSLDALYEHWIELASNCWGAECDEWPMSVLDFHQDMLAAHAEAAPALGTCLPQGFADAPHRGLHEKMPSCGDSWRPASGHSEPAPGLLELIKEVRDEYALALLDPEHSSRLAFEQFIGDLGELLARAALTAPPASGLREAVIEECCRAVCRYCEFASKPDSRWSKANSNGKHFDENVREEYCDAYPIRRYTRRAALTAPPAEAQGVQEQRESGKEK